VAAFCFGSRAGSYTRDPFRSAYAPRLASPARTRGILAANLRHETEYVNGAIWKLILSASLPFLRSDPDQPRRSLATTGRRQVSSKNPNFLRYIAQDFSQYLCERPEMTSHGEEPRKADKQTNKKTKEQL
jgi:hypothetical protein